MLLVLVVFLGMLVLGSFLPFFLVLSGLELKVVVSFLYWVTYYSLGFLVFWLYHWYSFFWFFLSNVPGGMLLSEVLGLIVGVDSLLFFFYGIREILVEWWWWAVAKVFFGVLFCLEVLVGVFFWCRGLSFCFVLVFLSGAGTLGAGESSFGNIVLFWAFVGVVVYSGFWWDLLVFRYVAVFYFMMLWLFGAGIVFVAEAGAVLFMVGWLADYGVLIVLFMVGWVICRSSSVGILSLAKGSGSVSVSDEEGLELFLLEELVETVEW